MTFSDKWLRFREAENEFFTSRYKLMRDESEILSDLQQAMTSTHDRETALRLLLDMKPEFKLIVSLLPSILDMVIDSGNLNVIMLTKNVLLNYKEESATKETVLAAVAKYVVDNDEWHYRRIAELYELLQYKEELVDFIALCKLNDNWEIREIGDDFSLRAA